MTLDRLARATDGLCLISPSQATFVANTDDWKSDTINQQLASQIANILYNPDSQNPPHRFTRLHKHKTVSALLAEYEPNPHVDVEQLKVILKHLKPRVPRVDKCETVVLLYCLIKTFFSMRREWLKAAGEFYGLLAYIEVCRELRLEDAGPSYPNQTVDFEAELLWMRERLETKYRTLQDFKQSDRFGVNMQHLFTSFQELKKEEERRQKMIRDTMKKAELDEKRLEIKLRNGRAAGHQLGPRMDFEMGDVQQQRILDLMTVTMQFELGVKAEE